MNAPRRQPRARSTQGSGGAAAPSRRAVVSRGSFANSKGSSAPSRIRSALLFTALSLFALAVVATSASARSYESQLTEANGTPFTNPYGLAVDGSDNLWVSDVHPGGVVDKFDPSGAFKAQSTGTPWSGQYIEGLAYSNASNHLFVSDSDHDDVWGLNPDASYAGIDLKEKAGTEWGNGCCYLRIAADNSAGAAGGDLYISNGSAVFRINAAGSPAPFSASAPYIEGAKLTGPFASVLKSAIAVAPGGNLYVASSKAVYEFAPSGEFTGTEFKEASGEPIGSVSAVAVDPSNENILVADSGKGVIDEFESSGAFLEALGGAETPAGSFGSLQGLAVNSGGELFVSDGSNHVVDVFSPAVVLPKATYLPVSGVTQTVATVKAQADPNGAGPITACSFQYGKTSAYGEGAPCSPATPYAGVTEVSAMLSGLTPGTAYHYRVLLTDANGTKKGADRAFRTSGPPFVGASSATDITGAGATINARVNPSGFDTQVKVLYGTTTSYGSESAAQDIGSSNEDQNISIGLPGLSASTVYHYRVVATNSKGSVQGSEDQSFETEPALRLESQAVSSIFSTCATFEAQVNPDGSDTSVFFEYGTTTSYGSETAPIDIGSANEGQLASKAVCGLSFETEYHFRAVAENAQGSVEGGDQAFTTLPPLTIDSSRVFGVNATEATLKAQINPRGLPTTYHFEYVAEAQFEASEFAEATSTPESASIGADNKDHEASVLLTDLEPASAYRFRVVAHNSLITIKGPVHAFTTFAPATGSLPDGRVYEAVSPIATEGHAQAFIFEAGWNQTTNNSEHGIFSPRPFEVAPDGNSVIYQGDTPSTGGTGNAAQGSGNAYLSTRSPSGGWNSINIQPAGKQPEYLAFSSDLSTGIISSSEPLTEDSPPETGYLYAHPTAASAEDEYQPLFNKPSGGTEPRFAGLNAGTGAVPASTHLLFSASKALLEGGGPLEGELEEAVKGVEEEGREPKVLYDSIGGNPSLVSVLPSGKPDAEASFGGYSPGEEGSGRVISADGSRIFWTDLNTEVTAENPSGTRRVFVRVNATQPQSLRNGEGHCTEPARACTIQLDASEVAGGEGGNGRFLTASANGDKAFFIADASAELTEDTEAGSGANLYQYDFEAPEGEHLTDLTPAAHADVEGLMGASDDGSYLYLVAGGALAPGVTSGSCCNVYLFHLGDPLKFIAALPGQDNGGVRPFDDPGPGNGGGGVEGHLSGDWRTADGYRTAEVTPDGHSLIFMSTTSLTGYDNEDHYTDQFGSHGESLYEVFLYQVGSAQLTCVSCNPSGEPPVATELDSFHGPLGGFFQITKSYQNPTQPRGISTDGSRVFFNSGEPLVPQDTNGWLDVYEWERNGSGSCHQSQGCVYLLSAGTGPENSYLLGAGASGDDAFIITRDQLVTQDHNGNFDVYDARVNGVPPPQEVPPCEGEACRGPVPPAPSGQSPGTAGFSGSGNEAPKHHNKKHKKKSHKKHKRAAKHKAGGSK